MKQFWYFFGLMGFLLAGARVLSAASITYDFGQVSGGTAPAGSPPWLQAIFTDDGLPANTVQLTLSAGNLSGNQFVSCWFFNLNPALDPTALSFAVSTSSGSFGDPSVKTAADGFKAGPDGKYDVFLGFSTLNGQQFTSGDSLTFTITGSTGLTASDFDQLSAPSKGSGPYDSAADIQSIVPDDGSAWINPTSKTFQPFADVVPAVPDNSATVFLLGASLVLIEAVRRKLQVQRFIR